MKWLIKKLRNWIKTKFGLYDIADLTIGGHCGCCGRWIGDDIFPKFWAWGLCSECQKCGILTEGQVEVI